jgi:hypothetical protein
MGEITEQEHNTLRRDSEMMDKGKREAEGFALIAASICVLGVGTIIAALNLGPALDWIDGRNPSANLTQDTVHAVTPDEPDSHGLQSKVSHGDDAKHGDGHAAEEDGEGDEHAGADDDS